MNGEIMGWLSATLGALFKMLESPSASGWVQAIGAILALAIAVWIPARQSKRDRNDRVSSLLAVAEAAHTHAQNIRAAITRSDFERAELSISLWEVYDRTIIDGIVRALQSVPLHELGRRDAVIAMLSLTDQMVFLGKAVEILIKGPSNHPELSRSLEAASDSQMRRSLFKQGFGVLALNVTTHLDRIDQCYKTLSDR